VDAAGAAYGLKHHIRRAVGTEDETFTEWKFFSSGFPSRRIDYTNEDDLANLESDPNLVVDFVYGLQGLLLEKTEGSGRRTVYNYDSMGRVTETSHYAADATLL